RCRSADLSLGIAGRYRPAQTAARRTWSRTDRCGRVYQCVAGTQSVCRGGAERRRRSASPATEFGGGGVDRPSLQLCAQSGGRESESRSEPAQVGTTGGNAEQGLGSRDGGSRDEGRGARDEGETIDR